MPPPRRWPRAAIKGSTGSDAVAFLPLDLADLDSVRAWTHARTRLTGTIDPGNTKGEAPARSEPVHRALRAHRTAQAAATLTANRHHA
jgi:hypothetical protein